MEFTNGEFLHLALVPNPRYERANIVVNSGDNKTKENTSQNSLTSIFLDAISEVVANCLGECRNSEPEFITVGEGDNKHPIPIDYIYKDKKEEKPKTKTEQLKELKQKRQTIKKEFDSLLLEEHPFETIKHKYNKHIIVRVVGKGSMEYDIEMNNRNFNNIIKEIKSYCNTKTDLSYEEIDKLADNWSSKLENTIFEPDIEDRERKIEKFVKAITLLYDYKVVNDDIKGLNS